MTDYYLSIDVHKTEVQIAVLDDEGQVEEGVRVNSTSGNLCKLALVLTESIERFRSRTEI